MNRSIIAVMLVPVLAIAACKSKNDVVATYDGGRITRGEFHEWMDMKRLSRDTILKSPKHQKNKLEMMALERFAVEEALKEGFDKNKEFIAFADMAAESQFMELLYNREIKEKAVFKEPAVRVRQIFIRIKDYKIAGGKRQKLTEAELKRESDIAVSRAGEIIARLGKKEKFDDLAKQYSDDFSKKSGGDIGFIVADMMPPEFSKAAFSLGEDEYTREPVVTGGGVYILQVVDREDLSAKNIDKIVKDKMQAARLKNRFFAKASREYLDALSAAGDVERHLEKAVGGRPSDMLFKVGEKVFTVADLDRRIALYTGRHAHGRAAAPVTPDLRKNVAENYFKLELLRRTALQKGLDKDPEYIKKASQRRDSILAREYIKHKGSASVSITEREMREEYDANRGERYYSVVDRGGKREKVVEPYQKVRERIKRALEGRSQSDAVRKWKEELLGSRNFAVIESKLEGDKEK
ncbi:MAG TPA: peptidylprolyl isomerase [Spirochaetota bacterium]|nr:peptidylprolyl isomerase [Spirochaetota bacterium]